MCDFPAMLDCGRLHHAKISSGRTMMLFFSWRVHFVPMERLFRLQALPVFLEILIFHLAACQWSVFLKWLIIPWLHSTIIIPFWNVILRQGHPLPKCLFLGPLPLNTEKQWKTEPFRSTASEPQHISCFSGVLHLCDIHWISLIGIKQCHFCQDYPKNDKVALLMKPSPRNLQFFF